MTDRDEQRLTEVEIKLTEQERLLETLNQVIIEQSADIASLRQRLAGYERALEDREDAPANERPPHY